MGYTMAKLNMADMWSATAEAYAVSLMDNSDKNVPHVDMQCGRKLIVTRVARFLAGKVNPVVLDVAAAGGEPALSMAKAIPHATIYGTDFAPGMVDMISKRCEQAGVRNLKVRVEDGQELSGFPDGSVDVVTCSWGLESMPERQKAIEQFHRVLKPGGMAIFAAWDKDPNSIVMKMAEVIRTLRRGIWGDPVDDVPIDIQSFGGGEGLKAMGKAGFAHVNKLKMAIPFYVPPGIGLRELFPFMVKPTPVNSIFSAIEECGYANVREQAAGMFEGQVLADIAQGRGPTGPGLYAAKGSGDPAFYVNAVVVEGYRKAGM